MPFRFRAHSLPFCALSRALPLSLPLLPLLIASNAAAQQPLFTEVAPLKSGIRWSHENGMSDERYLPETMGAGAAFLDYDNDGWMDVYLVNSGPCDFYKPSKPLRNALYRNNGDGTFSDVTAQAGVAAETFGMGAAAADYDNDGDTDLFVTAYGKTILYRNNGDRTFSDVSRQAGLSFSGWTTSAVWFEADNDGDLDLFVCQFVEFSKDQHISCGRNVLGKSYYCVPRVFNPTSSLLYKNNGDGTFRLASRGTAIEQSKGKALGVVAGDVNNDGWTDLFVANDTVQDFLFLNRGGQQWEEAGLFAGVGFSAEGAAQSGMGVDAADFDGDSDLDLFVSNIDHQNYMLFVNNGDESFGDATVAQGIAQATFLMSGWGLKFFDFDNDGDLDLIMANGHPDDMIGEYSPNVNYKDPLLLFESDGKQLRDISQRAGPAFQRPLSGRGLALGDFDNDGQVDALVSSNGEAPVLLRNTSQRGNHWLGIRLAGKTANRQGIGARLSWSAGGVERSLQVTSGGSYLSSHDPRQVLGLGKALKVDWLEVRWPAPSRRVERVTDLPADRYITIEEGKFRAKPPSR